jgi:aryl-alcohol dehydrogenase-like predicted oxidoreductase
MNNNFIKKIMIGTAQFGSIYGVSNKKKISKKEIKKIFYFLKKKKIQKFDTSENYADAELKIGKYNKKKKFTVSTKISSLKKVKQKDLEKKINSKVENMCKRLNTNKINYLLLHDFKDILSKNNKSKKIINILRKIKKSGKILNFGVSVYSSKDTEKIIKNHKIDFIQIPFNLFDQSLLNKNFYKKLLKKKIDIHVRSIFLQGLVFINYKKEKNKKILKITKKLNLFIKKKKQEKLKLLINFIKKYNFYKTIVIGVNSLNQLKEIIKIFDQRDNYNKDQFSQYKTSDKTLIDPRNWKV